MPEPDLIAAVGDLSRTRFAARAAEIDREGAFPRENIEELQDLGIPGMALAKDLGGLGVSATTQMRVMEEIAYGDASTAIALNMHILITDFITYFPPFPRRNAVLEDIGRNGALICGPASVPTGELDSRRAGFRMREEGDEIVIEGKAGFASMSEGAKYLIVAGTIDRGEGREPDLCVTLPDVATRGIRLLYNWDAMGLRGTASHDVLVEGARIPRSDTLIIPQAMMRVVLEAQGKVTNAATQNRTRGALGIAAIWLGLAQAAFDFTVEYVKERHGYLASPGIGNPNAGFRSGEAWAQFGIGNMEHWLETGRIVLYETVRRLDEPFASPQEFVRHLTRTIYHLRRMSEEVAQGAMRVCGAHGYVRSRPLERIFRDMVGGNVMAWKTDELQLSLGMGALGLPITFVGPAGT